MMNKQGEKRENANLKQRQNYVHIILTYSLTKLRRENDFLILEKVCHITLKIKL